MSNAFFISDLHLQHRGILKFGQRHFATLEEHDAAIIDGINSVIHPRDTLYILGDVSFDLIGLTQLAQLKTRNLILIRGNHDLLPDIEYHRYFKSIFGALKKYGHWLTHIPIHPQELDHGLKPAWNIHGHIHDPKQKLTGRYYNVGVDYIGTQPVSLDHIKAHIASVGDHDD